MLVTETEVGHSTRDAHRLELAVKGFIALLERDVVVMSRGLIVFLLEAVVQPLLVLFVFGKVLPTIGLATTLFVTFMLPGILALTTLLVPMQAITVPLVLDFGVAREIEDRLMAPLPLSFIVYQKVLFAALRGMIAGTVLVLLSSIMIGMHFPFRAHYVGMLMLMLLLVALTGACIGLVLGTCVNPEHINLMFAIIINPLLFTGCTYYPWTRLGKIPWFQVLTLLNPLTYATEGFRYAFLDPRIPGLSVLAIHWILLGLFAFTVMNLAIGSYTFRRRVLI